MIHKSSMTLTWYDNIHSNYKKLDKNLLDKVTHAFYLLERLSETHLTFIFKGGTCLLLLMNEIKRFSIDIDIIITEKPSQEELLNTFEEIVKQSIFTRIEEQHRYSNAVPKAHYKFYYTSPLDNSESYVMLDILFEDSPYSNIIKVPIENPLIYTLPPIKVVAVPDIDNILGDKLTVFAPNTTGIPYDKGKEMEIIKQLFDIENLFDQAGDLSEVYKAFVKCAEQELIYRQLTHLSPSEVLDDIITTACIIGGRGSFEKETFQKLEDGVRRIKSHIINRNYIMEEAVVSASKASYLASLLKYGVTEIDRFNPSQPLPVLKGVPLFKKMSSIKKFSPEAFYYFSKTQELHAD